MIHYQSNYFVSVFRSDILYYVDSQPRKKQSEWGDVIPLVRARSGERFFAVPIKTNKEKCSLAVLSGLAAFARDEHFLWPDDIINVMDFEALRSSFFAVYREDNNYYINDMKSVHELALEKKLGFENVGVRSVALELLDAMDKLYRYGMLYVDWNDRNFIFRKRMFRSGYEVKLRFNEKMLMLSNEEQYDPYVFDADKPFRTATLYIPPGRMTPEKNEYIEPFYLNRWNGKSSYHLRCDLYSLAVLMFRLLIGRFPFEGSLMDGIPRNIDQWIIRYFQNALFIFDEKDASNSIGDFSHEKIIVTRWNSLTDELRRMFLTVFDQDYLYRRSKSIHDNVVYLPSEWKDALIKFDFRLKEA